MRGFNVLLTAGAIGCAVFAAAASASPPAPTAATQLAADAAYCQSWRDRLNGEISSFNASCTGALDPAAYASCQERSRRLNSEIAQYNSACGS